MTFANRRINLLEVDVDTCLNKYGASPCTAGTEIHTGTSQAGATDNTIVLAAGASGTNDFYTGDAITLADGRRAIITAYNGTSKVATVDRNWPINGLLYSEQVEQWSQINVTVSQDVIAGPDGRVVADKIEETATPSVQHQVTRGGVTVAINDELWTWCCVRADERSELSIDYANAVFGASAAAHFDLANMTYTTGGAGVARMQPLWDGWVLLEYRAPATSAGTPTTFFRVLKDGAASYTGTLGEGLYLTGAQAAVNRYSEHIVTAASAVGLPDSVVYRILSVGGECYNTFHTCQDTPNYVRGRAPQLFCNPGAPVPADMQARPYVVGLSAAPTEIDVWKGLSRRAKVTVNLEDEPALDVLNDPYHATRSTAAQGTYLSRLAARSPNIAGRAARLRTAYTLAWSYPAFQEEKYIIESLSGPDHDGSAQLILKDPLLLTSRTKVPTPSAGLLTSDLTATATLIPLRYGDGLDYPDNTGFVRIGDEIIEYTSKDVTQGWGLNNSLDGWTVNNITTTLNTYSVTLESTSTDPQFISPSGLAINGGRNRYIGVRMRRLAGSGWAGQLYYTTASHGFLVGFRKDIADPTIGGDWVVAVWDMHDLTTGGDDWKLSKVTQLRLDFGNTATDDFEVDWVAYGEMQPLSADVLLLADTSFRGAFGTTAETASEGDGVQLCVAYQSTPAWQVLEDLLLRADIPAVNIGSTEMEAEDDAWLGDGYLITTILSEPEPASTLLEELTSQLGGFMWWDPVLQQARFQVLAPLEINQTVAATLTDEGDVLEGTSQIVVREDLRRTEFQFWYDRNNAAVDLDELRNFRRARLYIDPAAESVNDYGDVRPEIVKSRWYSGSNEAAVATAAYRKIVFYRDAPKNIAIHLDTKNQAVREGDVVDLTTFGLTDETGAAIQTRCLVVRRRDEGGRISLSLLPMVFGIRVAFLAPDGTGDYPTDPEVLHLVPDSGFFSDGTPGYQPF